MSYEAKSWALIIFVWAVCFLTIMLEHRAARARIRRKAYLSYTMSRRLHTAYLRRRISAAALQRILATYTFSLDWRDRLLLWWVTIGIKA